MTVNGHSLKEIGELMRAPFDESLFVIRDDGTQYLPSEHFKNRLDEVVGVMNYDYEIKSISRHESVFATGPKPLIEVQITITIKDDDGVPVKRCEGVGVASAIIVSATGKEKNPNGDVAIAEKAAIKHLCQNVFGMADEQLTQKNAKNSGNSQKGTSNNTQSAANNDLPKGIIKEKISITQGFTRRSANLYAKGRSEHCDNFDIVIFGKDIPEITKYMPEEAFINKYPAGSELNMSGSYGDFNGKTQFRFRVENN